MSLEKLPHLFLFYLQILSENCVIINYNETQKVTRIVIERTFGIFKMRPRCLDKCGRTELNFPSRKFRVVLVGLYYVIQPLNMVQL